MGTVDEYFAQLDQPARDAFVRIRSIVVDMVPEAEQGTSYNLACLMFDGKPLIGFLAARRHLSIFPFSGRVVAAVRDRLEGFSLSSGTIRFSAATPLPEHIVRDIVRHRLEEIVGAAG